MAFKNFGHYQSFMAGRERRRLRLANERLRKNGAESGIVNSKYRGTCPLSGWKYDHGEEIVRFRGKWCLVRAVDHLTSYLPAQRKGVQQDYETFVSWAQEENGVVAKDTLEELERTRDRRIAQIDAEIAEWEARIEVVR